jgi:hypothetical protein
MCHVQRQKEVVKNLYAECMALEELLEESVNTLGPDARDILAQVRWVGLLQAMSGCKQFGARAGGAEQILGFYSWTLAVQVIYRSGDVHA